jgi:phosphatidylglycerol---prolipoprotein diacylglyceryl transferase
MLPEINFFWFVINSYRLCFISWWLIVVWLSFFFLIKKWFFKKKLLILFLASSVLAIIWARLFHFFLHREIYIENSNLLFNLNLQWQAVIWWLFWAYLWVYLVSKFFKFNYWQILDICSPFIWLWIVIWRIGCLLAGCCFGKETNLPIWIIFPLFSPAHKYQLSSNPSQLFESHSVHPTQIYEMITGFLIFFVWIFILKKTKKDWFAILITSLIYLIFRLIDHFFRAPVQSYSIPEWFYPSFYIMLILIVWIILFKKIYVRKII